MAGCLPAGRRAAWNGHGGYGPAVSRVIEPALVGLEALRKDVYDDVPEFVEGFPAGQHARIGESSRAGSRVSGLRWGWPAEMAATSTSVLRVSRILVCSRLDQTAPQPHR